MECTCFDYIHSYPDKYYGRDTVFSPEKHLEIGYNLCNKFQMAISKHKVMSEHVELNQSSFGKYNLTEIKFKKGHDCHSKPFSSASLFKLMDRHYIAADQLEYLISRSNQQKFMVFTSDNFRHLLGHTNTVVNFVKCVKEYLQTKLVCLKNGGNINFTDTQILEEELKNYQDTLKIFHLFYSFRDYFSSDFDREEEKEKDE